MKKITLTIGLSLLSFVCFAQYQTEETSDVPKSERKTEYIIVLDDEVVNGNIDILLNGNHLREEIINDLPEHELAHDVPEPEDIHSKFIEGSYGYNEYALRYQYDPRNTDAFVS